MEIPLSIPLPAARRSYSNWIFLRKSGLTIWSYQGTTTFVPKSKLWKQFSSALTVTNLLRLARYIVRYAAISASAYRLAVRL